MGMSKYVMTQACVEYDTIGDAYVQVAKCAGIPCSPPARHSICLQGLATRKPLSVFPEHHRKRFRNNRPTGAACSMCFGNMHVIQSPCTRHITHAHLHTLDPDGVHGP